MEAVLSIGPLVFAPGSRRLLHGGREVARLPRAQALLLGLLAGGQTVSRDRAAEVGAHGLWRAGRGMDQAASQLRCTLER